MKKNLLLLSILIFLLNGCSQIDENDLIGSWKVIEFSAKMPELSPVIIEDARAVALSTSYEFLENKTFKMRSDFEPLKEGRYELKLEDKTIKMAFNADVEKGLKKYEVVSLSSKSMKWVQDMGDLGSISMILNKE